jgi:dienelactone hydrolase
VEFTTYWAREDEGFVQIGIVRGGEADPLTLEVATVDGTAKAGEDYQAVTGEITLGVGENVKLLTIPIVNDGLKEPNESFQLYLTNAPVGAVGAAKVAGIEILDNDPGVEWEFTESWAQEKQEALLVKLLRGNDADLSAFEVDVVTEDLTAVAGEDYTPPVVSVAFEEGEQAKEIVIPITHDTIAEDDERFRIAVSDPSGTVNFGSKTNVTATILDSTGMEPHGFGAVHVLSDGGAELTLEGGVHQRFVDYFDLYPIEVSTNLVDWQLMTLVQRTNSSPDSPTCVDREGAGASARFYRTCTDHLITPMLKPTGPRPVGIVNRWLTDPTRRNRFGVSTNGSFMATIWYPVVPMVGALPVSFEDNLNLRDPAWVDSAFDRLPYFVSHAWPEASCDTDGGPHPVVLFSHGLGAYRYQAAERAEDFASHGYVVVGVDHFDAFRPVFDDGRVVSSPESGTTSRGIEDRVRDLSLVLDKFEQWNLADPLFASALDLDRVAVMGFSWGGGTAVELCGLDARCSLAIAYDPSGTTGDLFTSQQKPLLQINGDSTVFQKAVRDAIWFQISSTAHLNFDDYYWFYFPTSLDAGREAARTINTYTLWFLNKYLRGSQEPMPPVADHPRVVNFQSK